MYHDQSITLHCLHSTRCGAGAVPPAPYQPKCTSSARKQGVGADHVGGPPALEFLLRAVRSGRAAGAEPRQALSLCVLGCSQARSQAWPGSRSFHTESNRGCALLVGVGDLDCVSCVSDGLCVCLFVSVVVCVSPSKICVCHCCERSAIPATPKPERSRDVLGTFATFVCLVGFGFSHVSQHSWQASVTSPQH